MPRYFNVRRYTLTTTEWTDVVIPENCSRVHILNEDNTNAQLLRSDKGDSDTQMTLLPSATLQIVSPVETFEHGTVVCSLKSQTGTGPIAVQFTR